MTAFRARDPDYAERVRESFAAQSMMATLGASLGRIEPGLVEIVLPLSAGILQQDGFVHGGALTSIADSAAGYAALTLMEPGTGVLTVELKMNFLAPARFPLSLAVGQVRRSGRTLMVVQTDVYGLDEAGGRTPIGLLTGTFMAITARREA